MLFGISIGVQKIDQSISWPHGSDRATVMSRSLRSVVPLCPSMLIPTAGVVRRGVKHPGKETETIVVKCTP